MCGGEQRGAGMASAIGPVGRRRRWRAHVAALYAVVAAAAGATYSNSLSGDFVWDDRALIVDDHAVKSWDHLPEIFSHDFFERRENELPYGYYRPVCTLSYLVDFTVWGLRPGGYHLTNVLLHAANACLVVSILLCLDWGAFAGLIAGLLFAVHPMHSENVAWIAGRTDLLAFFFSALALRAHLAALRVRGAGRARRRLLLGCAAAAFAAGLLAKEMSIVLIGWIAAMHFVARGDAWRAVSRAIAPYTAVALAYALWRFAALAIAVPHAPAGHDLGAAALSAAPTLVRYLAWLALPIHQSAYVQNPYVGDVLEPRLWGALAILAALAALYRRYARGSTRVDLALAMVAVAFIPIVNLVRVAAPADMGDVMAERFLYFPSFPVLALVGLGMAAALDRAAARPRALRWAVVAVPVSALAVATLVRNRAWHDELTLFTGALRGSPHAGLLWGNLANYHLRTGDLAAAAAAIDRAAAADAHSYSVLSTRALWYVLSGRPSEAIPLQERIVRHARKGKAAALNNLAYLYRTTGRTADAEEILERLVAEGNGYADVQFNLAEIYRARGDMPRARAAYRLALDDRPQALDIATALADLELGLGQVEDAERIYRRLLRVYPRDVRLLNNIALTRYKRGDMAGALSLLRDVVAAEPDYVRGRLNYAQLLYAAGRDSDAIAEMQTASQLAAGSDLEAVAAEQLTAMRIGRASTDADGRPGHQ
jgi:tetratricopeptide (TPR) repeat protein